MTLDVLTYHARDDAITLLDAGHCDVAVGVPPANAPGRIFKKVVFEEPFVCVVRKGHPGIDGPLDIPTFMHLEHLLVSPEGDRFGHTDEVLATMGLQRNLVVTTSQMYPAPQLVANSDLIATLMLGVVRASGCADRLEILQPPIALTPCPYVMAWHRRNDLHPAQRWLRECIEEVALAEPHQPA
jgi:DNA-binding transcriptional LysR family regulator